MVSNIRDGEGLVDRPWEKEIRIADSRWGKEHTATKGKVNRIGHILRRNSLLKQVTEGKIQGRIQVTRRGRRRRQLLDNLKEKRRYCKLKKGSSWSHYVDNTIWKRLCTCRKTWKRIMMNDYRTCTHARTHIHIHVNHLLNANLFPGRSFCLLNL